ncbi:MULTISPECIES: carboxymuconolactone decarboxylase family protein [Ramlibacter]|uniref:Carboxymuconolactone decarboxylase family protein n=1 Tax=Ramlibacter pinisoli TaxID=2682844 RepID=A0A6N8IX95_9BURK|nr:MULTISPECIES: carboxymuconolactone decarboxylase family protein [Ramlibacter]MBA2961454.1 carboxymuconolactone decarboxylase family protein [Ramlibacter sp. CGMCC 1.13660]MVQ31398.1 carboxymuconolactone decarboxylase family protein [Ramlibacter pinisoli]
MARIAYPDDSDPEVAALRKQIVAERGKLHNLYRMLLNSPPVAQGWLNFLTAIRQQCQLEARIRELAILRIAVINKADYEFVSHVPFAVKAGLSQQQIDAIAQWEGSQLFAERERAVLRYTDSMTRDVHVPDDVFAQVKPHFDARGMTELTATIAAYNLVSRFLEALEIDPEPH